MRRNGSGELSELLRHEGRRPPAPAPAGGVRRAGVAATGSLAKALQAALTTPECQLREMKGAAVRAWDARINPERPAGCPLSDRARAVLPRAPAAA